MSDIHTVLAVDFDGTTVQHAFPEVGPAVPMAASYLRGFVGLGAGIILWTCRDGDYLKAAAEYMARIRVPLIGANENPYFANQKKIFAHLYIDDMAFGAPLVHRDGQRPFFDWQVAGPAITRFLERRKAAKKDA